MKKSDLARILAKQSKVSRAEAADQLDRVVHEIINSLRQGHAARLRGLGEFTPGAQWDFRFEPEKKKGGGSGQA